MNTPRTLLPPTPPLRPHSDHDSLLQSPTATSPQSPSQATFPPFYAPTRPYVENEVHSRRHMSYPPLHNHEIGPGSTAAPPPFITSDPRSATSYHHSAAESSTAGGLAYQRSLPGDFPPLMPPTHPPQPGGQPPTWQHHHYFPPSATAPFAQSQERYICPTCSKPFSRPSSLKIHTYSHTGEKPYRCKHEGCGKYFSVRSNMKRHEKGCHGESSSTRGTSPGSV